MTYFSDPQETVSRFGDYIDEFQNVFRSNDVDYGMSDDFFAFARSLNYDAQLRASLSAVVKSIMAREDKIPLRTILSIIAVASGGPDVANSDRDMSRPVNLLIDFLIKAGGYIQISSEYPDPLDAHRRPEHPDIQRSVTTAAVAPDTGLTLHRSSADPRMRAEVIDTPEPPGEESARDAPAAPMDRSPHDYATGSDTLAESLSRLELNSLQLKHYLDSIDQRISRMEPRLENVPSLASANATPQPRDEPEAKFSAAIPFKSEPEPPQRDPPQPTRPPNESSRASKLLSSLRISNLRLSNLRLSNLRTSSRQLFSSRRTTSPPVLLALAALLLFALFLWTFGHDTTHADVHPANATSTGTMNADSISFAPSAGDRSARTSTPQAGNNVQRSSDPPMTGNQSPKNSATIPFSRTSPFSATPAQVSPPPPLVADASGSPDATDTGIPAPSARPYKWSYASPSSRLVNVSSGVMAANLLASPMPAYPRLASLTRMQGNVVMQAIISKTGTVESVRVIKGHRLLRSAATNAVRSWRYRPYLINGRPVEVATIVSVDFTLQR
jgi:TonB family protein